MGAGAAVVAGTAAAAVEAAEAGTGIVVNGGQTVMAAEAAADLATVRA